MNPEAIADRVAASVTAALRELLPSIISTAPAELLTIDELAARMKVSRASIKRYRADGMPVATLGKRQPRFDLQACLAWHRARTESATAVPKPKPGGFRCLSRKK